MNSPVVAVIDTGVGNLFSLARAIEEVDGAVVITPVPEELSDADLVIIPGVGSFASTMSLLVKTGMAVALRNYAQQGRPLPQHPGRDEDPLPGHPGPGPQGHRPDPVGHAMEARTERLRDNLRRPHASGGDQLMETATYTVNAIVPARTLALQRIR